MPHIANSLVGGATPRRLVQPTLNRFSPLKLLGTPRAPTAGSSLRRQDEDAQPRTIFSRASILRTSTTSLGRSTSTPAPPRQLEEDDAEDQTVTFPKLAANDSPDEAAHSHRDSEADEPSSGLVDEEDSEDDVPSSPVQTPARVSEPVQTGPRKVEGVVVESDHVKHGVVSTRPSSALH